MPIPVSTNYGEKFSRNVLRKFFTKSVTVNITNQDFEGELKGGGADRLTILQFLNNVNMTAYSIGTAMSSQKWLGDVESQLVVDQKYYYDFEIDNLERFYSYINDLDSALLDNAANVLAEQIDAYVLDLFTEVKAGHRIGSDFNNTEHATGAATVTTGTGAVEIAATGAVNRGVNFITQGITVTSSSGGVGTTTLVGLGVSFDGGVTWYKISSWTDSNTFVITDWNDSTYTGGTITSQNFLIEACYPKAVTKSTIYADICALKTKLDNDKIPKTDRYLVVPPDITNLLIQASELTPAIAMAYESVVLNGEVGRVAGFKIYESVSISGDATKGWQIIAGHKSFITFAHAFTESRVVSSEDYFSKKYQGLNVYGAKVTIERRKAGAAAFWIISGSGDDWFA